MLVRRRARKGAPFESAGGRRPARTHCQSLAGCRSETLHWEFVSRELNAPRDDVSRDAVSREGGVGSLDESTSGFRYGAAPAPDTNVTLVVALDSRLVRNTARGFAGGDDRPVSTGGITTRHNVTVKTNFPLIRLRSFQINPINVTRHSKMILICRFNKLGHGAVKVDTFKHPLLASCTACCLPLLKHWLDNTAIVVLGRFSSFKLLCMCLYLHFPYFFR
jgi:hypothetical protein